MVRPAEYREKSRLRRCGFRPACSSIISNPGSKVRVVALLLATLVVYTRSGAQTERGVGRAHAPSQLRCAAPLGLPSTESSLVSAATSRSWRLEMPQALNSRQLGHGVFGKWPHASACVCVSRQPAPSGQPLAAPVATYCFTLDGAIHAAAVHAGAAAAASCRRHCGRSERRARSAAKKAPNGREVTTAGRGPGLLPPPLVR